MTFSNKVNVVIEASFFITWNILVLNDDTLIISLNKTLMIQLTTITELIWIAITIFYCQILSDLQIA